MSASAPDLAHRYGTPSRARRPLAIAAVSTLALVGLGWLLWVALFHGRPMVTSELVGFDIAGQHAVTARFTVVRRDSDVHASCLLRAFADDHTIVGELRVPVAARSTTSTLSRTVRTERGATTVELVGCTAPGQNQPR